MSQRSAIRAHISSTSPSPSNRATLFSVRVVSMVLFLFLNYSLLLCSFRGTPLPSRQGQPVLIQAGDTRSAARSQVQIAAVSALYLNHLLATFSLSFLLVSVLLIFRVKNLLQDAYNLSSTRSTSPSVGEGGYSGYRPQTPGAKKISESALYLNSLPSRLPPSLPPFSSPSLPHSPSLPLSLPRDYSG